MAHNIPTVWKSREDTSPTKLHPCLSRPLSRGCNQQTLPRQSFMEHSVHMAEPV